jgi:hypothetical protein
VLVGATPQVLAQAAMTKQFNVKDEIEVKDDLDKKPNDKPANIDDSYLDDFAVAYADGYPNGVSLNQHIAECMNGCVLHKLVYFPTFIPDLERIPGTTDYYTKKHWTDNLRISRMEIDYSPSYGELDHLHYAFVSHSKRVQSLLAPVITLVSEKTEVTRNTKNRHLVVTTRLARGSLDSLLAKDPK